jgi:hypothetical protein
MWQLFVFVRFKYILFDLCSFWPKAVDCGCVEADIWVRKSLCTTDMTSAKRQKRVPLSQFGGMWEDHAFSDMRVTCGGQSWQVHRSVLATASPVFRSMLMSECQESQMKQVDIKEAEPEMVEAMLRHIYALPEQTDTTPKSLVALIDLASRYDVKHLVLKCVGVLLDEGGVQKDNVVAIARALRDAGGGEECCSTYIMAYTLLSELHSTVMKDEEAFIAMVGCI